jgi:branched-chain amino acid transport system ATP-binding protein
MVRGMNYIELPKETKEHEGTGENAVILDMINVTKKFGGLVAVDHFNAQVRKGSITALIGPNGSGKTTLFNLISGLLPLSEGEMWFRGRRIDNLEPHQVAAEGITRTFQLIEVFGAMSVVENVIIGTHLKRQSGILGCCLAWPSARKEKRQVFDSAMTMLQRIGLADKAFEPALNLGIREQRLLEIARALAAEPRLLLLDEPAGGLSAHEITELTDLILGLQESGITILLVEHHVKIVMGIADRIIALNYGTKIAEGPPSEVRRNAEVIASYLGREV